MKKKNHYFRGFLQSEDGVIVNVIRTDDHSIRFQAEFGLSEPLLERLMQTPETVVFSERSRIARLGVRMSCEPIHSDQPEKDRITLTLSASQTITGYPGMDLLRELFTMGLPVGRLVCCDPDALLSAGQVMEAVERSELKLPGATSISGDGSVIISPHKVVCELKAPLSRDLLEQILLRRDGRERLNRFQIPRSVFSVRLLPGQGVITTCSMYLNDHYLVLESGGKNGFVLGRHFPAIVLDPIKTRGIRIYLEIFNDTENPIVNPLITARVYRSRPDVKRFGAGKSPEIKAPYSEEELQGLKNRLDALSLDTCHYLSKPAAVIFAGAKNSGELKKARLFSNGPETPCMLNRAACLVERRRFTPRSLCAHISAVSKIRESSSPKKMDLVLRYFPNLTENREILNMIFEGRLRSLYFYEASFEQGPFLSQRDHNRLKDYNELGLEVYWISGLNKRVMIHTLRDGKGYFVVPERLSDFHKAMLFAFYGSNKPLSPEGTHRLGRLMDNLIEFWGKSIGIVTGGGSGVMELVNTIARQRGILSGANFLDITDQSMTTDVDFCQVFQSSCRHSRQKWFEIASFPIFNVGGIGTLEELGITLCNMKLSIMEPVPVILFDTEGNGEYWRSMKDQIEEMVKQQRAPSWIAENLVITDDPDKVVAAYRERLQLF